MDLVSDLIIRINNALLRCQETFEMPASKLVAEMARVMVEEGFLSKYEVVTRGKKRYLKVALKYALDKYGRPNQPVILGIKRISRSSRRVYRQAGKVARVQSGFGTAILSTNQGLLTDAQARRQKIGGELLAYIW